MKDTFLPADNGPLYAETLMGRFPVEPWATATNLVFLFVIIYFARFTRGRFRKHPMTVLSLPVLFIGWLGGTLFHACRNNNLWLLMDILPIVLLAFSGGIYLWSGALQSLWRGALMMFSTTFLIRFIGFAIPMPRQFQITFGYAGFATGILLGAYLHSRRNDHQHIKYLYGSLLFIVGALVCRAADSALGGSVLPMGTHWLWHLLGGGSVWCILNYIALSEDDVFSGREALVLSELQKD